MSPAGDVPESQTPRAPVSVSQPHRRETQASCEPLHGVLWSWPRPRSAPFVFCRRTAFTSRCRYVKDTHGDYFLPGPQLTVSCLMILDKNRRLYCDEVQLANSFHL